MTCQHGRTYSPRQWDISKHPKRVENTLRSKCWPWRCRSQWKDARCNTAKCLTRPYLTPVTLNVMRNKETPILVCCQQRKWNSIHRKTTRTKNSELQNCYIPLNKQTSREENRQTASHLQRLRICQNFYTKHIRGCDIDRCGRNQQGMCGSVKVDMRLSCVTLERLTSPESTQAP